MKRKIVLLLLVVFIISTIGAAFAALYVRNTTKTLSHLIDLHQIEVMRKNLTISIQTVQSELNSAHTNPDRLTKNAKDLEYRAKQCSSCHHSPDMAGQIDVLKFRIGDYQHALDRSINVSVNPGQRRTLKRSAIAIGDDLLDRATIMSARASANLELMTQREMKKIERVWVVLSAAVTLTFLLGIIIA